MGKFFNRGGIDSSGNVRETADEIARAKEENREIARLQQERNQQGSGVSPDTPLFSDQVDLSYTQTTLRDQSKAEKFSEISGGPPIDNTVRGVFTDDEGRTRYAAVNSGAQAQSIAFAANQIAQSQKLGLLGGGDTSMISDPLVMRAVGRTGLPSTMDFRGYVNQTGEGDYGLDAGNIYEASKGVALDPTQRAAEVQRLIDNNVFPVGDGGTTKQLRADLLSADGNFQQRRRAYVPASAQDIDDVMNQMWGDTNTLKGQFFKGLMDPNNPDTQIPAQAFQDWVGDPAALPNDSLWMSILLAYYRTLEEASYADYSEQDKTKYENWAIANERMHEDLFMPKNGQRVQRPKKKVVHEKFGDYIEEVTRTKFKNGTQKQIVANTVLDIIQNSSIRGHNPNNIQVNPNDPNLDFEGELQSVLGMALIEAEGTWQVVEDIKISDELHDFLAYSKGIRDILQPNFRNHVRVIAKNKKDRIDINGPIDSSRASGVSRIRSNAQNIQEEMPMMIDPLGLNMIQSLYTLTDSDSGNWYEYLNNVLKVKPQHYQLMLQENSFINQNSPDGKTFYPDTKRRDSGRSGHSTLVMSDMKLMRALTIPRFESFTFNVEKGGKMGDPNDYTMNADEKLFMFSVMRMLGRADHVPEAIEQEFNEIMTQPDHEWRRIARSLNNLARTGQAPNRLDVDGNNNPDFITIEDLKASGAIKEGFHSLQALRALDNYIRAKSNPNVKEFSTKFTTELDAAQSGPTIQGAQIGNFKALIAGGLPTFDYYYNNRKNKKSRFTLPKLYAATAEEAKGRITKIVEVGDNKEFISFVQAMFGSKDALGGIDLENLWKEQVGFAKTGLVGASYGQGEDGSVLAIAEQIKKHFEESVPIPEVELMIDTVNKMFGKDSIYINPKSGRLHLQGEAFKQLHKLAEIYTNSMMEVDPNIRKYSENMRKVYNTLVMVAQFQKDHPTVMGNFKAPQMTYKEPKSLSFDDIYNGRWVDGMSNSMLRENIQEDAKKFSFLDSEIFYKEGSLAVDIDTETEALRWNNPRGLQSEAITRFPVVSIHGLDDLVKSITISELKRKYPDDFNFYIDVWDAGIVLPHMAARYAEEYNKAWVAVMDNNRFFDQITRGLVKSLNSVGEIEDTKIAGRFDEVKDAIDAMRTLTNEIYEGVNYSDKPFLEDRTSKRETSEYMEAFGIDQIYAQENEPDIRRRGKLASSRFKDLARKPMAPTNDAQAYLDSL
jgi:hypothetical protein